MTEIETIRDKYRKIARNNPNCEIIEHATGGYIIGGQTMKASGAKPQQIQRDERTTSPDSHQHEAVRAASTDH